MFTEKREQRTTDIGNPLVDEEYAGAAFRWGWNFGEASTLSVQADFTRRDTGFVDDELRRFALEYRFRFNSRFSIAFLGQRSEQEEQGGIFSDYTENQYRITLRAALSQVLAGR